MKPCRANWRDKPPRQLLCSVITLKATNPHKILQGVAGLTMTKDKSTTGMTGEELLEEARKLCEKEGAEGWKLAQTTMLEERACNQELQDAIEHAMLEYKPDYFRPALLSFCSRAVGGKKKATVSTGAALTLFAWAIGIHDDIIDKSRTKNGHPTILGKFGSDLALILSDVLLFKGFTLLRRTLRSETPIERVIEILETIEKVWFEQSEGEAIEIQHRGLIDVPPKECLEKIRLRASEIEACARIGGILGGGATRHVKKLGNYGRLVGMMGILRNEVIDMLDLDALKHRVKRESLPLPVVYALQDASTRPKLISLITKRELVEKDLQNISRLSDTSGGIEKVARLISEMSKEANSYSKSFESNELQLLAIPFRVNPIEWKKLLSD
jgi:geranylgeranyl pyrophosphate synthase